LSNFGLGNGNYNNITVENVNFKLVGTWTHFISVNGAHKRMTFDYIKVESIDWTSLNQKKLFVIGREDGTFYCHIDDITIKNFACSSDGSGKLLKLINLQGGAIVSFMYLENIVSNQNAVQCYLYPVVAENSIIKYIALCDSAFNNMRSGIMYFSNISEQIGTIYIRNIMHDAYSACKIYSDGETSIDIFVSESPVSRYGVQAPQANRVVMPFADYHGAGVPNVQRYFNAGELILTDSNTAIGVKCISAGTRYTNYRQPSTAYTRGTVRKYGEDLLICIASGTTSPDDFDVYENTDSKDGSCYWRVLFKGNAEFAEV
jgi:hypothetical protein